MFLCIWVYSTIICSLVCIQECPCVRWVKGKRKIKKKNQIRLLVTWRLWAKPTRHRGAHQNILMHMCIHQQRNRTYILKRIINKYILSVVKLVIHNCIFIFRYVRMYIHTYTAYQESSKVYLPWVEILQNLFFLVVVPMIKLFRKYLSPRNIKLVRKIMFPNMLSYSDGLKS